MVIRLLDLFAFAIGLVYDIFCKILIWAVVFILAPIIAPAIWYINYFGNGHVRKRHGEVQVPIVTYEHPKTKKTVVLVGTIHFAEEEYYSALEDLVDVFEIEKKYVVLYEDGSPADPGRYKEPPESKPDIEITEEAFRRLGIKYQHEDVFEIKPTWIRTDMCMEEIDALLIRRGLSEYVSPYYFENDNDYMSECFIYRPEENRTPEEIEEEIHTQCLTMNKFLSELPLLGMINFMDKRAREHEEIIVDLRDQVAFNGIMHHLQYHDGAVSIWGAAHLPGIGEKLKKAGFKETEKVWVTFYHTKKI